MDYSKTYQDYFLNLKKVDEIKDNEDRKYIRELYNDALQRFSCGERKMANSFFKTLFVGGYISNYQTYDRNKKIDQINS